MTPFVDSRSQLPMDAAVAVNSSAFIKVAYDQQRTILQVEFRDGSVWQYLGVPFQTYQDLLRADSKGAYLNRHVRNLFSASQLSKPTP